MKIFVDSINSSLCALKYECLLVLSIVEICLCVALQDDLLMNWGEMTILWLGERYSSYDMIRDFVFDALKSYWIMEILLACVNWMLKQFDVVKNVMNSTMILWSPCCGWRALSVIRGQLFPSGGYYKTPNWVRVLRSYHVHLKFLRS